MTDNDQVELTLKTSWLIPTRITGAGQNVSVVNQVIPNGHLLDHQTLNTGNYEANVPVGPDACAFRDSSLIGAQSYSVSVIDQNGTPEVTTNSISVDSNHVAHFRISGIHFSQPIINIKGVKKSLTCVAANKIKVIEGANSVCPKGFIPKK